MPSAVPSFDQHLCHGIADPLGARRGWHSPSTRHLHDCPDALDDEVLIRAASPHTATLRPLSVARPLVVSPGVSTLSRRSPNRCHSRTARIASTEPCAMVMVTGWAPSGSGTCRSGRMDRTPGRFDVRYRPNTHRAAALGHQTTSDAFSPVCRYRSLSQRHAGW